MSLVTLLNLSLGFGGRELLKEVNFQVEPGQRIGLVGPNGSGKTSLLRMIIGELSPDRGEIRIARGARVGYLPQDVYEALSGHLLQSMVGSIPSRVRLEEELKITEGSLGDHPDPGTQGKLAAKLAEIHHAMIDLDTQYPVHLAEKILVGLGFKEKEFERPISSLSGGWKTRTALAQPNHGAGLQRFHPEAFLAERALPESPTSHGAVTAHRFCGPQPGTAGAAREKNHFFYPSAQSLAPTDRMPGDPLERDQIVLKKET